jgi:hypothetical protein
MNVKTTALVIALLLMAPTAQGQSLEQLLSLAGAHTERFTSDFGAVTCLEQLTQVKLDPKGKAMLRQTSSFDYVGFMNVSNGIARVEESRVKQGPETAKAAETQLVTNGFSTLMLIFHPQFRDNYEFADWPTGDQKGVRLVKFQLKQGARSTTVFKLRDRNYQVEWQGEAWIDPASGAIQRIHVHMMSPIGDLGLQLLDTEVEYSPVQFRDAPKPLWLPREVTVNLETRQQHWRNTHTFHDYKMFSVSTSTKEER